MTSRPIGGDDGRIRAIFDAHGSDLQGAVHEVQRTLGPVPNAEIDTLLPIFDYCDIPHHTAFQTGINKIKQAIIERIKSPEFSVQEFKMLIHPTLKYLATPLLSEIPLTLLEKFPDAIGTDILDAIKSDPRLFDNCSMNLRRRIWLNDPSFFHECIYSMVTHYVQEEPIQYNSHIIRPEDYGKLLSFRRNYPTFKLFASIADNGDPQMYHILMNTLEAVFEQAPYPELASLRFDLAMYYHSTGIKVADIDPCFTLAKIYETMLRRCDATKDLMIYTEIESEYERARENNAEKSASFLLLEPTANHYLAKRIVEWLRNTVEDDADDTILGTASAGCSRIMSLAERILKQPVQLLPPPHEINTFWLQMCTIIIKENSPEPPTFDVPYIENCLRAHEVARKIFVQYAIDRLYHGDMHTLARLLPLILNTLPVSNSPTESHVYTYQSFIRTMTRYLLKKKLLHILSDPWKQVIMDNFLIQIVRWNSQVHKYVIHMLQEYLRNERLLSQAGSNISIVCDWIINIFNNGAKSQEEIPEFHHLYANIHALSPYLTQALGSQLESQTM